MNPYKIPIVSSVSRCRGLLRRALCRGGPAIRLARATQRPEHGAAGGATDGWSHLVAKRPGENWGKLGEMCHVPVEAGSAGWIAGYAGFFGI